MKLCAISNLSFKDDDRNLEKNDNIDQPNSILEFIINSQVF